MKFYRALLELYYNGRKPILKSIPYSFKSLKKKTKKNPTGGEFQQRIIGENIIFLKNICKL